MTHCNCPDPDATGPPAPTAADHHRSQQRALVRLKHLIRLIAAAPLRLHRYRDLHSRLRRCAYRSIERGGLR